MDSVWRPVKSYYVYPTLLITFQQSIIFQAVVLTPGERHQSTYVNICIYLDPNRIHAGAEEVCTEMGQFGWVAQYHKFAISATRPKETNAVLIRFPEYKDTWISAMEIIYRGTTLLNRLTGLIISYFF